MKATETAPIRVIVVGGFLGAGKTTLLRQAGRRLVQQGKRVGIVTNDQAENLVDTETLRREGFGVEEVAGGCFCCRFSDLLSSSKRLMEAHKPDVLLCEPVGSCTDLAATVLRPMQTFLKGRLAVGPYSVLVDPLRLKQMLAQGTRSPFSEKVLYIYNKQLEEADVIVLNKADALPAGEFEALQQKLASVFPRAAVIGISALEERGLDLWLEQACADRPSGQRGIHVNYDIYAEGEAELGWLNAAVRLRSSKPVAWKPIALDLLKALKDAFHARNAEVAHVKLSLTAPGHALTGNLTSTGGLPFLMVQGTAEAPSTEALLIVNARVQIQPDELKAAVQATLESGLPRSLLKEIERLDCFSPSRPVPEHRLPPPEPCNVGAENPCGIIREIFKPKKRPSVT